MTQAVDWESLINEGIEARKLGDNSAWALGDLAGQVETHYGEGDIQKYAGRIGCDYGTLQNQRTVAARFELSCRHDNLSFTHHQVAATRDDADARLAKAEFVAARLSAHGHYARRAARPIRA